MRLKSAIAALGNKAGDSPYKNASAIAAMVFYLLLAWGGQRPNIQKFEVGDRHIFDAAWLFPSVNTQVKANDKGYGGLFCN